MASPPPSPRPPAAHPALERGARSQYASLPTAWTRHLRVNLLWQLWRFALINLRMLRIIALGHKGI
jgi:hypothetical protein